MTKFQCHIFFTSEDIKPNLLLSSNLDNWWRHKQSSTKNRRGKDEGKKERQKFEYLKNKKSFFDELKNIFHNYLMVIIYCIKKTDTSFKNFIKHHFNLKQVKDPYQHLRWNSSWQYFEIRQSAVNYCYKWHHLHFWQGILDLLLLKYDFLKSLNFCFSRMKNYFLGNNIAGLRNNANIQCRAFFAIFKPWKLLNSV